MDHVGCAAELDSAWTPFPTDIYTKMSFLNLGTSPILLRIRYHWAKSHLVALIVFKSKISFISVLVLKNGIHLSFRGNNFILTFANIKIYIQHKLHK